MPLGDQRTDQCTLSHIWQESMAILWTVTYWCATRNVTADGKKWKLHKHETTVNRKINRRETSQKKITMNARKMQFIARLPKNISAAATNRRNFTSDRGLWMNTVLKRTPNTNHCVVQTSGDRREFQIWVRDKKDGYKPQKVVSNKQHMIDGFKMLRSEFKLWKEEVKERLLGDPILVFRPGGVFDYLKLQSESSYWN